MANEGINVRISANATQAEASIRSLQNTVASTTSSINTSFNNVATGSVSRLNGVFSSLGNSIRNFGSGVSSSISSISPAVGEVGSAVANSTGIMSSGFSGLLSSINPVSLSIAGIGLAMAGAIELMSKSVDKTRELGSENIKLSKALNISVGDAVAYRMAIDDAQLTNEEYTSSLRKLENNVRNNEAGLNQLGVATRNSKNELLSSVEIMDNASQAVSKHKAGVDQDAAAQEIFGKNVDVAIKLGKVNNETLRQGAIDAKAMGLAMSDIDLKNVEDNRLILKQLEDQFDGIYNTIGTKVIPIFTEITTFFSDLMPGALDIVNVSLDFFSSIFDSIGDVVSSVWSVLSEILGEIGKGFKEIFGSGSSTVTAMEVFKNSVAVVKVVFISFSVGIQEACEIIKLSFDLLMNGLRTFANVAVAAMHLDFNGITSSITQSTNNIQDILSKHVNKMVDIASKGKEKINIALVPDVKEKEISTVKMNESGTKLYTPLKKDKVSNTAKSQDRDYTLQILKAQEDIIKAHNEVVYNIFKENNKREMSLNDSLYNHNKISLEQYYKNKENLIKSDFDSQISLRNIDNKNLEDSLKKAEAILEKSKSKKNNSNDISKNELAVLKIKKDIEVEQGKINLLTLQEKNAILSNTDELNKEIEAKQKLADLSSIKNKEGDTKLNYDLDKLKQDKELEMGRITNLQSLQLDKEKNQKSYEDYLLLLKDKLAAAAGNEKEIASIKDEARQAERDQILKQAELSKSIYLEQKRDAIEIQGSFKDGFKNILTDMMSGKKSFKDSIKDMISSITDMFNQLIAKKLAEKLFGGVTDGGIFDKIGNIFNTGNSSGSSSSSSGGGILDSLGSIGSSFMKFLPSFDVGTSYVPNDQVAKIHKGERILTAKENREYGKNSGQLSSNLNVHNNFILNNAPDQRTQMQMAALASSELQRAMKRNN